MTLEFGKPYLAIQEPIHTTRPGRSQRVRENLARSLAICQGQWGLWITYAYWKVTAKEKTCDCQGSPEEIDRVLQTIDGQKLLSADFVAEKKILTLKFDLGSLVEIWKPDDANAIVRGIE